MAGFDNLDTLTSLAPDDELLVRDTSDTTDDASGTIKKVKARKLGVSSPWLGATVHLTSLESVAGSTITYIPWDLNPEDEGGWWSAGAPTRLTVPAGVTRVKVYLTVDWDGGAGEAVIFIRKNGSTTALLPQHECNTAGGETISLASRPLAVSPGDYFEAGVFNGGSTRNLEIGQSHFAIEAIG